MKTKRTNLPLRNLYERLALLAFLLIMFVVTMIQNAQAQSGSWGTDPFLVEGGHFTAGLLTTYRGAAFPAPVLIGEASFGVSSKTTLGLVGGTTGSLALFGPKFATQIFRKNNFRLIFRMDMIYYPERKGTFLFDRTHKDVMPWMFTMGTVDAQWKSANGMRWSLGLGFVETHCIEGMMNFLSGKGEKGNLPLEVFNTMQGSVTFPLSRKFMLRPEVIAVFDGVKPVEGDHKVIPLYAYLHLTYSF